MISPDRWPRGQGSAPQSWGRWIGSPRMFYSIESLNNMYLWYLWSVERLTTEGHQLHPA